MSEQMDVCEDLRRELAASRFAEREWRNRAHDLERDLDEARTAWKAANARLAELTRVDNLEPSESE